MKKACSLLFAAAFVVLAAACGSNVTAEKADNNDKNSVSESFAMLQAEEWPENEYTAVIPRPESGTVARGWIDQENDRCFIDMTGVNSETMKNWYSLLLNHGFTEMGKTAEPIKGQNYVSTNAVLQRDGTYVSMTHLDTDQGNFELCITKGNSTNLQQ